jgi:Fe-S-cluster containining protein
VLRLSDENVALLRDALAIARQQEGVSTRIEAIYRDVQDQIDARKPRCDISGRCCRFDEYGHRLFVTTLEIAAFAGALPGPVLPVTTGGCPYQIDRLCTVHAIRPFGCRIYFCDPTAQDWQHAQYEDFHLRLRDLHAELAVPYFYVDWLEALRALGRD